VVVARTKRSANLEFWSQRQKLEPGTDHTETLALGRYLLYRRPLNGAAGSWTARFYNRDTKKMTQAPIGHADDFLTADGMAILTYAQATTKAEEWFKEQEGKAILAAGGEVPRDGPYLVKDVMAAYLARLVKDGAGSAKNVELSINAHILLALGEEDVSRLTKKKLEEWHQKLAAQGKRKSVARGADPEHHDPPTDPEQIRQRKDTANRILTNLKAALNMAMEEGKVHGAAPWREVMPFKDVGKSRVRFLEKDEHQALVNAITDPEFQALVIGALATGARYGELSRCKVHDFDAKSKTLFIQRGKNGKSRHIKLAKESVPWFIRFTKGRAADEPLFKHTGVARDSREDKDDWMPYDQVSRMRKACKAAGIKSLGFHELRHTYASGLVNEGMPLIYVAAQLGHRDTRMVERYYGHLAPTALSEAVDAYTPKLGIFKKRKAPEGA
jgi:integrase